MSRRGMTLMELIMVVIIVGILATMALPGYSRTIEVQYFRGAQDVLQAIYAGQQVFFVDSDGTYRPQPATMAEWRDELYMDDPNVPPGPVTYAIVTAAGDTQFTATATRAGTGPFGGGTATIDEDRTMLPPGAPWPP